MSATPELIAAYEKALYVVFGTPELVIRIGEPNPDLDELLEAEGAASAAFITAANPRGEVTSSWKNEMANAALVETQTKAGYACFEGEGRDPQGRWTPEWSGSRARMRKASGGRSGRTRSCSSSEAARPSWSCWETEALRLNAAPERG